jgi:hypothetical protein
MNTYLAIITTILVLTQVVRVAQNAIQLSKYPIIERDNNEIMRIYKNLDRNVSYIRDDLEERGEIVL